ncbi:efflux RND transporter permease subunit [Treponema sp.]|uniref:efflux RND transporter permease subunit n=1 Tax=Treponema sp. TaxID=166 RepID=UPI00388CF1FE
MILHKWYRSKRIPLLMFIFITCLLIYSGRKISFGNNSTKTGTACCIEVSYPGMNGKFLEEEIAIPLENQLAKLSGIKELSTVCEESRVTIVLDFDENINKRNLYFDVSRELDIFKESISYPIQNPRIYFDSTGGSPDLIICIYHDSKNKPKDNLIEKDIVPLLEGLKEVSMVRILGNKENEISIKFDSNKIARKRIVPQGIAELIQDRTLQDICLSYDGKSYTEALKFKTKVTSLNDFSGSLLKTQDQFVKLSDFCSVSLREKEVNEMVKLNGRECIEIEIYAKNDSSIFKLSKKCQTTIRSFFSENEYMILYDEADVQLKSIKKILLSLLQSFALITVAVIIIFKNKALIISVISFLPVSLLWNLFLLSALGIEINKDIITGICISLGIIIDPLLVIADLRIESNENDIFLHEIQKSIPALLTSIGTNIIVFIPFFYVDKIIPGISNLCFSIVMMIATSFILAVLFYPIILCRIEMEEKDNIELWNTKLNVFTLSRKKARIVYVSLITISIFAIFFLNHDIKWNKSLDLISVNIEYNPEKRFEFIDKSVGKIVDHINKSYMVEKIISISRKGSCELKIFYDRKKITKKNLINLIDDIKTKTGDGIPFIDDGMFDRKPGFDIEVAIEGLDSSVCRKLAKELADKINRIEASASTVLNFKGLETSLLLTMDDHMLNRLNCAPLELADNLYWYLGAPIINKWIENMKEYDVRLLDEQHDTFNIESLIDKKVFIGDELYKIGSAVKFSKKDFIGKLHRKNNKPCAKITVHFKYGSMKKAKSIIMDAVKEVGLPENYSFSFDKRTKEYQDDVRNITFSLLSSIILLFVFICIFNENPKSSLAILSIIPAAFAFPLGIKLMLHACLTAEDFIGMAVASGLVVNNAILIESSGLYRNRKSIFLTNLTTIMGAIPMILLVSSGIEKDLAFYMLFSSAGAMLISFLIFPRIISDNTLSYRCSLQVQ